MNSRGNFWHDNNSRKAAVGIEREERNITSELTITIKNGQSEVKKQVTGQEELVMVHEGAYKPGDTITSETSETDTYHVTRVDDTMNEAYVYLASPFVGCTIPLDEKEISYNPRSFTDEGHYITMRNASGHESESCRNLTKDVMDQHGDLGCYPHAYTNMEIRSEFVPAARNAIDGMAANESHGAWSHESWGTSMQDDTEMTLDSGRPVNFDTVVLYIRADSLHDSWWMKVTSTLSNGSSQVVEMGESVKPHSFQIEKKGITWMKLSQLIKADDPPPSPTLSQIEVYRKNAK